MDRDYPYKKRLIHVYTGKGKGKTTAALGLALRACGHGWRVLMIQFMKGDGSYGEALISKKIPQFEMVQYGLTTFISKENPSEEDIHLAQKGFHRAEKAVAERNYDLIILDEINVAVNYGLISLEDVKNLLKQKPDCVEMVLTGRNAHPEIIKLADLVSEVVEIKHPIQQGIPARKGIDF